MDPILPTIECRHSVRWHIAGASDNTVGQAYGLTRPFETLSGVLPLVLHRQKDVCLRRSETTDQTWPESNLRLGGPNK
jgi:hypothetical protein